MNSRAFRAVAVESELEELTLITQNVDGFHRAAGSERVVELHGNIMRTIRSRERTSIEHQEGQDNPPHCPRCGAPGRPDVVWFGETLPADALARAFQAARGCELFFSIGASSAVEPAASLPWVALEAGATVVEINPRRTAQRPRPPRAVGQLGGDPAPPGSRRLRLARIIRGPGSSDGVA